MDSQESEPAQSYDDISQLCDEYQRLWKVRSTPPELARFFDGTIVVSPETLFRALLNIDIDERRLRGLETPTATYTTIFPQWKDIILSVSEPSDEPLSNPSTEDTFIATDESVDETFSLPPPEQPTIRSDSKNHDPAHLTPERIGRYIIERVLGKGGYGQVFLARDTQLERHVALKVPHAHRLVAADIEEFLAEARTLASLDHPAIVPVYDFDRYGEGCFVVTKFIEGETLTQRLKRAPMTPTDAIRLLHRVAETLNYIHLKGVVHRDIKPSNLMLEVSGDCYITDFGLALRDFDYGLEPGHMGTMSYMSPEQARGESHLVDGRSDLFSLGVVMYELLTGARPFTGENWQAINVMICYNDPLPPRQRVPSIPKELERICLKLLSKRANDRYPTAQDLADDLQHVLADPNIAPTVLPRPISDSTNSSFSDSRHRLVGIIPRGLRSFDQEDSMFFRELLPGPRNRDGLPDSLTFWKRRIESTKENDLFRVGVIYGPSGSGKSSFLKAGLLPMLESRVTVVFVEASGGNTEYRLQKSLSLRCPDLPGDSALSECLSRLRRETGSVKSRNVLIVIDQFEQWLHDWDSSADAELAVALRQCDGQHVQCLLLVRDDFWLAMSRFAETLEVDLLRTRNLAMVDLFDKRHARKVLAEYGRGYARLPDNLRELTKSQNAFLDQAIDGLAEADKVIPVQLATFSEIMKSRDWDVKSLNDLGGVEGVGVRFLEESFSTANAPAPNRSLEKPAQAVLRSLLPDADTNIKGAMRSEAELQAVSGFASEPQVFRQLMQILDTELRLITPTESSRQGESDTDNTVQIRFYQLTHDFLVPAVRSWLERRQQLTLTGRASMRLADRTEVWTARPSQRHLPSWLEWVSFLLFTRSRQRDTNQQRMMKAANRRHVISSFLAIVGAVLLSVAAVQFQQRSTAHSAIEQLTTADNSQLSGIIDRLETVPSWSKPLLSELMETNDVQTPTGLRARLSLLRLDPKNKEVFTAVEERVLTVEMDAVPAIREELQLSPLRENYESRLWKLANDETETSESRFRAALLLASYVPPTDAESKKQWASISDHTSRQLIQRTVRDPLNSDLASRAIMPARKEILPFLLSTQSDEEAKPANRRAATSLILALADDLPSVLLEAFLNADEEQLTSLLLPISDRFKDLRSDIEKAVGVSPALTARGKQQQFTANRQVNAAALMAQQGHGERTWELLKHSQIPNTRTGLIRRLKRVNVNPQVLLDELGTASDGGIISAMIFAVMNYADTSLTHDQRDTLQEYCRTAFHSNPSRDVHGAAEWALRKLNDASWVDAKIDELSRQEQNPEMQWAINTEKLTFVQIDDESPLEVSSTEITVEQFLRFRPAHTLLPDKYSGVDSPVIQLTWLDAVKYCRWLTSKEGLSEDEQCYPPDVDISSRLDTNYKSRRGYRLLTTAEWETAAYGISTTLLPTGYLSSEVPDYGWVLNSGINRVQSVYGKRPNSQGLFGMLGNATEWTSWPFDWDPDGTKPHRGPRYSTVSNDLERLLLNGKIAPVVRYYSIGFRVCRHRLGL